METPPLTVVPGFPAAGPAQPGFPFPGSDGPVSALKAGSELDGPWPRPALPSSEGIKSKHFPCLEQPPAPASGSSKVPRRLLKPKMQMSHCQGSRLWVQPENRRAPPSGGSQTFMSHWYLAACVFGCALGHVPSRGVGVCLQTRPGARHTAEGGAPEGHPGVPGPPWTAVGGGKRLVREARCGPWVPGVSWFR